MKFLRRSMRGARYQVNRNKPLQPTLKYMEQTKIETVWLLDASTGRCESSGVPRARVSGRWAVCAFAARCWMLASSTFLPSTIRRFPQPPPIHCPCEPASQITFATSSNSPACAPHNSHDLVLTFPPELPHTRICWLT